MTYSYVSLKRHNFVTTIDVMEHILPHYSAKERQINYSIFINVTVSCSLRTCT